MDPFSYLSSSASDQELSHAEAQLTAPPTKELLIIACMDARVSPSQIFGLALGEAQVLRNAGARATQDILRSTAISTNVLGAKFVVVLQHTDCGVANFGQEDLAAKVAQGSGRTPPWDFLTMSDMDEALAEDVTTILNEAHLPAGTVVAGYRYDVSTGKTQEIVPARLSA